MWEYQFAEGLSDLQAAYAVRSRIDWKYACALELTDPGFDASVLTEFRARLLRGHAEQLLFETLLAHLRSHHLVEPCSRQRTDSTHVLAAIQVLNRLECIGETLRHALNSLASAAPDWLQAWVPLEWFDRYTRRFADYRLPDSKADRYALADQIGADGSLLLERSFAVTAPLWLREIPAVETLRRVWVQQFYAAAAEEPVHCRDRRYPLASCASKRSTPVTLHWTSEDQIAAPDHCDRPQLCPNSGMAGPLAAGTNAPLPVRTACCRCSRMTARLWSKVRRQDLANRRLQFPSQSPTAGRAYALAMDAYTWRLQQR